MIYEYRNASYHKDGGIDCEVNHPKFGWIPHLVHEDDNPAFFQHLKAEGGIGAYTAPVPSTDPRDYPLERWQFQAMVDMIGKRSAIEQAISALPSDADRAVAYAKLNHTDVFQRTDPLVVSLSALVGMSSDELDSAWLQAKDLT